jgi:thioredoxin reductase (NADPH)
MSEGSVQSTEVAVVGSGPIGLEMAVALKRAGIPYVQFDAKQVGHTISWFAPQTRFFSSSERIAIAGVPLQTPDQSKATREEYLTYLRCVVEQFDLAVNTYEPVVGIEGDGRRGFVLTTRPAAGERAWRCRRLILCTGGTDHPRMLNIPGEDLPHVSHYFEDPHKYFRKRVLVVGGKNSAVEAALRCHHAGASVSLSYRRDRLPAKSIKYWLLPEISALMQSGRIQGHFLTAPRAIAPAHVTLVRVGDSLYGHDTFDVPADFVLLLTGYVQDNTLFRLAGVRLEGDCAAPAHDPRTMGTNVPGLYVAGTAVGGTQDRFRVFIENCHVHVARILAALTGAPPPEAPPPAGPLES